MIRETSGPDEPKKIPNIIPSQSDQLGKAQNKKSQFLSPQLEDAFVSAPSNPEVNAEESSTGAVTPTVEGFAKLVRELFPRLSDSAARFLGRRTTERYENERGPQDIV